MLKKSSKEVIKEIMDSPEIIKEFKLSISADIKKSLIALEKNIGFMEDYLTSNNSSYYTHLQKALNEFKTEIEIFNYKIMEEKEDE